MRRIGVVVKYYPPLERVSGIIGLLRVLHRALGEKCELHVITSRPWRAERDLVVDGHQVHRCAGVFPIAAGRKAQELDLDGVVFVSGIFDQRKAPLYVEAFSRSFRSTTATRVFLQATHVDGRGNPWFVRALSRFDAVAATSVSLRTALAAQLDRPVTLLLPGVEIPEPREPSDVLTIGFVNHLNAVKGADIAMEAIEAALARHPEVQATVAGTGELASEAERRFAHHDRVRLLGFLEEGPLYEELRRCDIMLLPFRTGVSVLGISQTVLEVMASGNVVVGTAVPPIAEAITTGETGLLGTAEHIGELLESLLVDRDRRATLGATARAEVVEHWNIADRVEELLRLLDPDPTLASGPNDR